MKLMQTCLYVSLRFLMVFSLLLIVLQTKGQNYIDSARQTWQQNMRAEIDSADRSLWLRTIESIDTLELPSDDSLFLAFLRPLMTKLNDLPVRYQFIKLNKRFLETRLSNFPKDQPPPLYKDAWIEIAKDEVRYFDMTGDKVTGLKKKMEILKTVEGYRDTANIIETQQSIGFNYFNLQDFENARDQFFSAYELAKKFYGNEVPLLTYYSLLEYGLVTDSVEMVQKFGRLAIEKAREEQNRGFEGAIYRSISYFHFRQGAMDSSYQYALASLQLAKEYQINTLLPSGFYRIIFACINQGRIQEAEKYGREMEAFTKVAPNARNRSMYYEVAYELALQRKDYKAALTHFNNYTHIKDSLNSETIQQQLYDQKYQYEYKQRSLADSLQYAADLQVADANLKRRTQTNWFLGVFLLFVLVVGILFYNRFKLIQQQNQIIEEEKRKLDQANSELNAANQKLTELDNFKSQFFTNISHEFRTPLTVITGMTEQMQQKPDKWQEKGVSLIDRNARGLLHLINQILDLRKLESGNLGLTLMQGDVIQALRLSCASFESMAESKDIELVFSPKEPSMTMDFDPEKLGQITNNLLSNAVKFTHEGGYISMRSFRNTADQLVLEVKDSGRGIPADKLPYIFDRFYQVDGTDTRQGEGTGVGLSLTKELVQLMEGEIRVESTVGKGTTFTVMLPIRAQAEMGESLPPAIPVPHLIQPEQLMASAPSESDKPSLLIIEDNADIVVYLQSILEDQYVLYSAPDGQQGIDMALEQVPDLIITDVMMPHKNGYEVTETLKLDERTSHIPILMLTAKADASSRLEGYKRGADAYLAKPFNEEELHIRLQKLHELRTKLQARYQGTTPSAPSEDPIIQQEDAFVTRVRELLLANLDDSTYKGEALMKDLGIGRTNLHRKIKALTGMPISRFIHGVRIEQARELLRAGELQVAEIAYTVGYNEPTYFNRMFREIVGKSPGDWREEEMG